MAGFGRNRAEKGGFTFQRASVGAGAPVRCPGESSCARPVRDECSTPGVLAHTAGAFVLPPAASGCGTRRDAS
jgi:hypothetical protein